MIYKEKNLEEKRNQYKTRIRISKTKNIRIINETERFLIKRTTDKSLERLSRENKKGKINNIRNKKTP